MTSFTLQIDKKCYGKQKCTIFAPKIHLDLQTLNLGFLAGVRGIFFSIWVMKFVDNMQPTLSSYLPFNGLIIEEIPRVEDSKFSEDCHKNWQIKTMAAEQRADRAETPLR